MRLNAALVHVELGELDAAEALAQGLIREDPNFVDALALLAAVRWLRGDAGGAASAVARLCTGPSALCERYASVDVVRAVQPQQKSTREPEPRGRYS